MYTATFDVEPSAQDILSAAIEFFIRQKKQSAIPDGVVDGTTIKSPRYRHPTKPLMCPIAVFISDYHENMETHDVHSLVEVFFCRVPSWFEQHVDLLS